ncbi:MAG: UbiA family prenyltransferase [Methanomicrobiales archaeon]|nr:UbiA family prenyltransferase [Methanomicrobiales archaeon]
MMRIADWIRFYPLFPLAGAFFAGAVPAVLAGTAGIFFFLTAYGFVVNNYYDVDIDRRHLQKARKNTNPLAAGQVSRAGTRLLMAVLLAFPLIAALCAGWTAWLAVMACAAALTLYSAPPLRLKDRSWWDVATHALMFGGLPFLAGVALAGGTLLSAPALAAMLLASAICAEALIIHQINDYAEDCGTAQTTVVALGKAGGWGLLFLSVLGSFAALALCIPLCLPPLPVLVTAGLFLLLYPVVSCRREIITDGRTCSRRIIVSCLAYLR